MFPPSARHSSLRTRRLLSAVSGFASVFLGLCLALERSDLIRIDTNHEVVDMIDRLCFKRDVDRLSEADRLCLSHPSRQSIGPIYQQSTTIFRNRRTDGR